MSVGVTDGDRSGGAAGLVAILFTDLVGSSELATQRDHFSHLREALASTGGTDSDGLWAELISHWSPEQLVDPCFVAGTYRTASYLCNTTQVDEEPWMAPFPDAI